MARVNKPDKRGQEMDSRDLHHSSRKLLDWRDQLAVTQPHQQGAVGYSLRTTAAVTRATVTGGDTVNQDGPDRSRSIIWTQSRKMMSRHRERQEVEFKTEGLFSVPQPLTSVVFANVSDSCVCVWKLSLMGSVV